MRFRKLLIALRRLTTLIALVVVGGCVVLLLNFTAPNPTGRRYSSSNVITRGNPNDIGRSGEDVLSKDLRLPNNNDEGQRKCICPISDKTTARGCHSCFSLLDVVSSYAGESRRPDFVSDTFIADSKNAQQLVDRDDYAQIEDFVNAANSLGIQLWVFVRSDTYVTERFYTLVESTGGKIVHYFADSSYIDPVDDVSRKGLLASSGMIGLILIAEIRAARRKRKPVYIRVQTSPSPEPSNPRDPMSKAERKVGDAEAFKQRTESNARRKSDEADSQ